MTGAAPPTLLGRARLYLELVRFSHTLFALPFAVMALFLAAASPEGSAGAAASPEGSAGAAASPEGSAGSQLPDVRTTLLIVACMVCARTAAMAWNRLVDRDVDAANPRTRGRHLPRGQVRALEVLLLALAAGAAFVACAWFLNRLAFLLSFPVLAFLLAYSHAKRFTALSHFVLGAALGLAPLAVWIAVRGTIDASLWLPASLGLAVLLWVAGFDILYACQDAEFDRAAGLHSVPARLGVGAALRLARVLHAAMVVVLFATGAAAGLGLLFHAGVAIAAVLLLAEHRLVKKDDLSRLDVAFFTLNGWISVLLCAFTVAAVLT